MTFREKFGLVILIIGAVFLGADAVVTMVTLEYQSPILSLAIIAFGLIIFLPDKD